MKKNGFTLIEIVLSISIVVVCGLTAVIAYNAINKNTREKQYERIINEIEASGEVYYNTVLDQEEQKAIYNGAIKIILLGTLQDKRLVQKDVLNPINNKEISKNSCVKISLDSVNGDFDSVYYEDQKDCISNNLTGTYTKDLGTISKTVEQAGYYTINLYGAQGNDSGGKGGNVKALVYLTQGEVINIEAGGQTQKNIGGNDAEKSSTRNGGGASKISVSSKLLLAAAGGGGGKNGTPGGEQTSKAGQGNANSAEVGKESFSVASVPGTDGDGYSGGGAGNLYNTCEETGQQVWNECLTGSNTCKAGYVNTTCNQYNRCSSCGCSTYESCRNKSCGCDSYGCPSGYSLSGSSCKKVETTTITTKVTGYLKCYKQSNGSLIWDVYKQDSPSTSCPSGYTKGSATKTSDGCKTYQLKKCSSVNSTRTCTNVWKAPCTRTLTKDKVCSKYTSCQTSACGCDTYKRCSSCSCALYNQEYDSCATGSNTCKGGYELGTACSKISASKYYSGNGGINYISDDTRIILDKSTKTTGVREKDGVITISFEGETL